MQEFSLSTIEHEVSTILNQLLEQRNKSENPELRENKNQYKILFSRFNFLFQILKDNYLGYTLADYNTENQLKEKLFMKEYYPCNYLNKSLITRFFEPVVKEIIYEKLTSSPDYDSYPEFVESIIIKNITLEEDESFNFEIKVSEIFINKNKEKATLPLLTGNHILLVTYNYYDPDIEYMSKDE